MCQHSNVKCYDNIYGIRLKLHTSTSSRCNSIVEEIVIESQPFELQKWLTYLALIMAILLHIGIHHQHATALTVVCSIFIIVFLANLHWKVTKESLLIMKNIGIEITTVFASGRKSSKFIAWERIHGTVINEAITMQQVLFYLAILLHNGTEGEVEIVPLFQHIMPRLECLKTIYQRIHHILDKKQ